MLDAGIIQLTSASALGASSGSLTVNGGTLSLAGNSPTLGAVTLTSGNILGAGTITGASFNVQTGLITANLAGTSAALAKTTAGLVTLTGTNTYGGGTTISAGTLQLGSGSNDGTTIAGLSITPSGNYNIASGAVLAIAGTTASNGAFPKLGIPGNGSFSGAGTLLFLGTNSATNTTQSCLVQTAFTSSFSGTIAVQNANYAISTPYDYGGASLLQTTNGGALFMIGSGTYNVPMSISGRATTSSTSEYDGAARRNGAICIGTYGVTLAGPITLTGNSKLDAVEMNSAGPITNITGQITGPYQLQIGTPEAQNGGGTFVFAPRAKLLRLDGPSGRRDLDRSSRKPICLQHRPLDFDDWSDTLKTNGYSFSFSIFPAESKQSMLVNGGTTNSTVTIGSDNTSTTYAGLFADGGGGGTSHRGQDRQRLAHIVQPKHTDMDRRTRGQSRHRVLLANGGGSAVLGAARAGYQRRRHSRAFRFRAGWGNPLGITAASES